MRRRMGRPGLVGTMARTAVITGTAGATMNAMNRGNAPQPSQMQPVAPTQPQAVAPGGMTDEKLAKLKQLGELHTSGVLNEQEFAQAKAALLA